MVAIICVAVSLIAGFIALSVWQDRTSQGGGIAPNVDVAGMVFLGGFLALATALLLAGAPSMDNPELNEGFVCKRVHTIFGDHGYNWAPDRKEYLATETLGTCVSGSRQVWEMAIRDGLLDGMVAMNRLDDVLEAQGIGEYERSDVNLAAYDLWKQASKYKK